MFTSCAAAQWGDFGGFGGFGGDQSSSTTMEYSEKFSDVDYVGDNQTYHKMDIYLPKEQKDSYPVVIHTYGSAWSSNNSKGSADLNTICASLLKAGYAVVTPNHRSSSDAIFPAQMHDLKAVVRFVRGNAAKYKFDTSFVAASGFSSGAHLSGMLATTCGVTTGKSGSVSVDIEGDLGDYTSFSSCVTAASVWSAPTNLYTMTNSFEETLIGAKRSGNEDKFAVASSTNYVDKDDSPIILFHGSSDNVVPSSQSEELEALLKKEGVEYEYVKVSGGGHGINMYTDENLNKMVSFLDKVREKSASSVAVVDPVVTPVATPVVDKKDSSKIDTITFPVVIPTSDSSVDKKDSETSNPVVADNNLTEVDTSKKDSSNVSHQLGISMVDMNMNFEIVLDGNTLFVKSSTKDLYTYRLFSVNGMSKSGLFEGFLDLRSYSRGIYFVEIIRQDGVKQGFRFVKK